MSTDEKSLRGAIPMLPTPFDVNGQIDISALIELVRWHRASDSLAILGFGSECLTLGPHERALVQDAVVDTMPEGQLLLVGCTARTESESVELVSRAAEAGAHAVMVAPPQHQDAPNASVLLRTGYRASSRDASS